METQTPKGGRPCDNREWSNAAAESPEIIRVHGRTKMRQGKDSSFQGFHREHGSARL